MRRVTLALLWVGCAACLSACGGSGSGGGGDPAEVAPPVGNLTVTAKVTTAGGFPLANIPIMIAGAGPFVTDETGEVVVSNVPEPYTAIVFDGAVGNAVVYTGLTRPDPTFEVAVDMAPRFASIEGKVTGGAGLPVPVAPPHETEFAISVPAGLGSASPPLDPVTGDYTEPILQWEGPFETTAYLTALQYEVDGDGQPVTFTGYGKLDVPLQVGDALTSQHVVMGPVDTTSVSGTVDAPADYLSLAHFPSVGTFGEGTINLPVLTTPGSSFTLVVPKIPGTTLNLVNSAWSPSGAISSVFRTGIVPPAVGVTIRYPLVTEAVYPFDGALGIDYGTLFQVSPNPGERVHQIDFEPVTVGPKIRLHTTDDTFTLPDLRAWGLAMPPGSDYDWTVRGVGPASSVNDMLVAGWVLFNVPGMTERFGTVDGARRFTVSLP